MGKKPLDWKELLITIARITAAIAGIMAMGLAYFVLATLLTVTVDTDHDIF